MRHLIDQRAPVTTDDIDQAIRDARWWLDDDTSEPCSGDWSLDDLIARLLAIVEDAYGDPEGMA
jgi:hypothetical protein